MENKLGIFLKETGKGAESIIEKTRFFWPKFEASTSRIEV
jgi:hypothetical protein